MTAFSKTKYLRSILFVFFLTIAYILPAQQTAAQGTVPAGDEKTILLDAGAAGVPGAAQTNAPSSIWILVRIVLVLGIVCVGIYGVVFLMKKTTRINAGNDPYIKNVASMPLSTNKAIQVITVGSQAFLIGVTDQSISLISEINDRELIDAMNLAADRGNPVPPDSFSALLNNFLPKKNPGPASSGNSPESSSRSGNTSGDSASALATADFLRSQRERLQQSSLRSDDNSFDGSAK